MNLSPRIFLHGTISFGMLRTFFVSDGKFRSQTWTSTFDAFYGCHNASINADGMLSVESNIATEEAICLQLVALDLFAINSLFGDVLNVFSLYSKSRTSSKTGLSSRWFTGLPFQRHCTSKSIKHIKIIVFCDHKDFMLFRLSQAFKMVDEISNPSYIRSPW